MRLRKRDPLLVCLVTLCVVLVPVLAFLQYQWLGKLSILEGQALRSRLQLAANQFSQSFDRELTRAFLTFQLEPIARGEDAATAVQSRLLVARANWEQTAPDPKLVKSAVYRDGPCEQMMNADIPSLSIPIHRFTREPLGQFPAGVEAMFPVGCLVVSFDIQRMRQVLFPSLAKEHQLSDDNDVLIAIYSGPRQVFASSPDAPAPGNADLELTMFSLRADTFLAVPPPRTAVVGRSVMFESAVRERVEFPPTHVALARPALAIGGVHSGEEAPWRLLVRHRAGSLDSAINAGRRWNLAVSFSIQLLLAGSIFALAISARRARRLAAQQVQFVASMSHELRTPLAGISSLAQNQEEGTIREPEQIRKYGILIRKEARRLMDMLEQTLTFAATSRPAEFTEIQTQDLISDALSQQATQLDQLGFTVETSVDADLPAIRGDRRALTRAVTNLVSNSIKYSNGHRWLFIRARAVNREVRITVEDRGIGLDASERDHLFEPFVRGRRAVNAQIPGSGLGLSIVRSTLEAHGGRVSLEPNAGEGVSATLYLPVQ